MTKILIDEATVKQVIAAIKKCHFYMIDADLPEQSMLVEAYKAYAALEAALAEQPAQLDSLALNAAIGYIMRHTPKLVHDEICKALRRPVMGASPQPAQQEPVATGIDAELVARLASATPEQLDIWLVAARRHEARKLQQPPAQRTWVYLTDEERNKVWREVVGWGDLSHDDEDLMKAVEDTSRRKNNVN
jgi:hypothetical protein